MRPAAPTRRQALAGLGALLATAASPGHAGAASLPAPASMAQALSAALARAQPLVVLASLHRCPYCQVVREHYLVHERAAGLPVVQIDFRDARTVRDFNDAPRTHAQLIQAWGVEAAPTVLFFGRGGREVAKRLSGYLPDFYASYLEERLRQARASLRT